MTASQNINVMAYVGKTTTKSEVDRNEWYTPELYLNSVRAVLGDIVFDPFTDEHAQKTVKALLYRTKETQNQKYQFVAEYRRQFFQGIVLVNNATETKWFQQLLQHASALCLTDHRIAFDSIDGKSISENTRGQVFFYFGTRFELFIKEFKQYGMCVKLS